MVSNCHKTVGSVSEDKLHHLMNSKTQKTCYKNYKTVSRIEPIFEATTSSKVRCSNYYLNDSIVICSSLYTYEKILTNKSITQASFSASCFFSTDVAGGRPGLKTKSS